MLKIIGKHNDEKWYKLKIYLTVKKPTTQFILTTDF